LPTPPKRAASVAPDRRRRRGDALSRPRRGARWRGVRRHRRRPLGRGTASRWRRVEELGYAGDREFKTLHREPPLLLWRKARTSARDVFVDEAMLCPGSTSAPGRRCRADAAARRPGDEVQVVETNRRTSSTYARSSTTTSSAPQRAASTAKLSPSWRPRTGASGGQWGWSPSAPRMFALSLPRLRPWRPRRRAPCAGSRRAGRGAQDAGMKTARPGSGSESVVRAAEEAPLECPPPAPTDTCDKLDRVMRAEPAREGGPSWNSPPAGERRKPGRRFSRTSRRPFLAAGFSETYVGRHLPRGGGRQGDGHNNFDDKQKGILAAIISDYMVGYARIARRLRANAPPRTTLIRAGSRRWSREGVAWRVRERRPAAIVLAVARNLPGPAGEAANEPPTTPCWLDPAVHDDDGPPPADPRGHRGEPFFEFGVRAAYAMNRVVLSSFEYHPARRRSRGGHPARPLHWYSICRHRPQRGAERSPSYGRKREAVGS